MLQAAVGAVVNGFAEAFDHFSIYGHDGRSHGRFERQATIRRVGPRFVRLARRLSYDYVTDLNTRQVVKPLKLEA